MAFRKETSEKSLRPKRGHGLMVNMVMGMVKAIGVRHVVAPSKHAAYNGATLCRMLQSRRSAVHQQTRE